MYEIRRDIFTCVVIPYTKPIKFTSILSFMYSASLGMNLSSSTLNILLKIAMGLKSWYVGISGQTLFKGTNLALKIPVINLTLSGDHNYSNI